MASKLLLGLNKAARKPGSGWRTNFLSQPEEAIDEGNTTENNDEVVLLEDYSPAGGTKRCLSSTVKQPNEYQLGSSKIPKVSHTPNGQETPVKQNKHQWGFSNSFDSPKGSNCKQYMIERQASFGRNSFTTALNRKRRDSPFHSNRHTVASLDKGNENLKKKGPFDLEIDSVRYRGIQNKDRPRGVSKSSGHSTLLETIDQDDEEDKNTSDSEKDSIIADPDLKSKQNSTTSNVHETSDSQDPTDFLLSFNNDAVNPTECSKDTSEGQNCYFCNKELEVNKSCTSCGRGMYTPAATPRPSIHANKDRSTTEDNRSTTTYGDSSEAESSTTKNVSNTSADTDSECSSNARTFYSSGMKVYNHHRQHAPVLLSKCTESKPSDSTKGQGAMSAPKKRGRPPKNSPKTDGVKTQNVRKKKKVDAKPVCVLISSSDEEDAANDCNSSKDEPTADASLEDQPKTDVKPTAPEESDSTPKPSKNSIDPFDRDTFKARISLGEHVMLGILACKGRGTLEVTTDQIKWSMILADSKATSIYLDAKHLTSFKMSDENPKIIVLGVTQAFALQLRSKYHGNGKFIDPGSAVSAEREIVLEINDTVSAELIADLQEWVTDTLSKEFKNLSVSEAESILNQSKSCGKEIQTKSTASSSSSDTRYNTRSNDTPKSKVPAQRLIDYPGGAGSVTINTNDIECLKEGEFLNDVIIDFYLKYIFLEKLSEEDKERTHIFNSFFYKRLTQRRSTGNVDQNKSLDERMHSQVMKWTRNVDIFQKDFIIVPINESSHWYLAIICFPGQHSPIYVQEIIQEDETPSSSQESTLVKDDKNDAEKSDSDDENVSLSSAAKKVSAKLASAQRTKQITKSGPCILVFDSLGGSGRTRVTSNLRNYLMCEWKLKKPDEPERDFTKDSFKGGFPKVPEQDNHCDCGVFVLQYVESFFENPLTDFKIPIRKPNWFPLERVSNKRQEIRELILRLKERYDSLES